MLYWLRLGHLRLIRLMPTLFFRPLIQVGLDNRLVLRCLGDMLALGLRSQIPEELGRSIVDECIL